METVVPYFFSHQFSTHSHGVLCSYPKHPVKKPKAVNKQNRFLFTTVNVAFGMADSMAFSKRGDCAVYVREKYATAAAATTAHTATSSLRRVMGNIQNIRHTERERNMRQRTEWHIYGQNETHGKRKKHETKSKLVHLGSA